MLNKDYLNIINTTLRSEDIEVKKRLGQNFLLDETVMKRMTRVAELDRNDVVLEVGPGLGFLTEKIAVNVDKIIAVEKDRRLCFYLSNKFKDNKKVNLHCQDIFKFNFRKAGLKKFDYKIIANLPFYITSRFLRVILENEVKPTLLVLLVQKEVAERSVAKPGNNSLLSLSVQFYGDPEIIGSVSKESFYPVPAVDSSILKIKVFKKPKLQVKNVDMLFRIIRIGFSSKRKQLHNNFSAGFKMSNDEAKNILLRSDIDPSRRAQSLSLEEWRNLYENVESII